MKRRPLSSPSHAARRRIAHRAIAAAALSLLIAAPEIGVDSILLSWPLLGGPTTIARVVALASPIADEPIPAPISTKTMS